MSSRSWFWKLRVLCGKANFIFERNAYKRNAALTKAKENTKILGSFALIGLKSLFWVLLFLVALVFFEQYVINNYHWLSALNEEEKKLNLDQLRLYAQLLTAIFSIYFATIGIILSAGYTRLRRDVIHMLTNEQVGSVYSRVLVLAAMFCLVATALPLLGYEPGLFVYISGTVLTLLSALALFPLGQRLFNFFDLKQLVRSEILPNIALHIEGVSNRSNSISLANHHLKSAQYSLEQLSYIDEIVRADNHNLKVNLPALTESYKALLLHYLQKKHTINQTSYWFPRRNTYKQWFLAGDSVTSIALKTSSQQPLIVEELDQDWLENEIIDKLAGHVELAFQVGDYELALKLIIRISTRISVYAERFQFEVGMKEIRRFKEIIEHAFSSSTVCSSDELLKTKIEIADAWAALGSNLCIETLRRIMTFENELKKFFEADEWNKESLRRLPTFLQAELTLVVDRINFEQDIEGKRLSKPKYVQQLAVQKLLERYAKVVPEICDFYQNVTPNFVHSLTELKMPRAATQVVLSSLHNYWKLPRWIKDFALLLERYSAYEHYKEEQYKFPDISTEDMVQQLVSSRESAIAWLGNGAMVGHIFEQQHHNDELPDHFGQIYFELAEACVSALEDNDESQLDKVLPMFMSLAFIAADLKFADPSLDLHDEFRLHLISTVINDLASVLGFAILYGAYFDNESLAQKAIANFEQWIDQASDKQQYLKRMVLLSNTHSFSMSTSPRSLIRIGWKLSFERRARKDGYTNQRRIHFHHEATHSNKIVSAFLRARAEASHLFFATQIVPRLEPIDFKIDYHITALVRQLSQYK